MQPSNPLEYEPARPSRSWMDGRSALVLGIGAVLGALLWAFSPTLTAEREPWDAMGYYIGGLVIAGFLAAWPSPRRFWLAPLGIYAGQMLYIGFAMITGRLPPGPLWVAGASIGLVLCLFALAGAAITLALTGIGRAVRARSQRP